MPTSFHVGDEEETMVVTKHGGRDSDKLRKDIITSHSRWTHCLISFARIAAQFRSNSYPHCASWWRCREPERRTTAITEREDIFNGTQIESSNSDMEHAWFSSQGGFLSSYTMDRSNSFYRESWTSFWEEFLFMTVGQHNPNLLIFPMMQIIHIIWW